MGLDDGFWLCAFPMVGGCRCGRLRSGVTCGAYTSVYVFMAVSPSDSPLTRLSIAPSYPVVVDI
jgi:hypothetical protein